MVGVFFCFLKMTEFRQLIEKGELARERANYDKACFYLEKALVLSAKQRKWTDFTEALAHQLLIDKIFYQKTKDQAFLKIMESKADLGLKIAKLKKLAKTYQAVFKLRKGDVYFLKKDFSKAASCYRRSVKLLENLEQNYSYGEYLYHLGQTLFFLKKKQEAKNILLKSLRLIEKDKSIRPFHSLNLRSKVMAWLALSLREKEKSKKLFTQALALAQELKKKYKMPARLEQLKDLKRKYRM